LGAARRKRKKGQAVRDKTPYMDDDSSGGGLAPTAARPAMRLGEWRRDRLLATIARFKGKRILVVGDMVADEYVIGTPARISREAPVLVLTHADQYTVPGGATNPGVNARMLGAEVFLAGVVGDDGPGERLRERLNAVGISMDSLFCPPPPPPTPHTPLP